MSRLFLLAVLIASTLAGCQRITADAAVADVAAPRAVTGPRWVVVKAEGLSCSTCAAELKGELEKVAGLSQIETFAPSPYCRFYVEDGSLDVPALLDELPGTKSTLAGWTFVRGG
jgi:copper chaperone CopZ